MPPWVKTTLAILSGLLCALAVIGWVLSYIPPHSHLVPYRGTLLVAGTDAADDLLNNAGGGVASVVQMMAQSGDEYSHFLGFARIRGSIIGFGNFDIIAVPFWFIVLVTGVGPALWWARVRRRRGRLKTGRCAGCGYDLRATDSGRCPECGAAAPPGRTALAVEAAHVGAA
jgi:hypothetical protein